MISRNNYRKFIIKDFVKTENFSNHLSLNKNIIRNNISSNELNSPREKDLELKMIQRYKKSLDSKNIINKLRLNRNKQLKLINTNYTLNKTPEKEGKNKNKYIKNNYSADQNKLINNNKLAKNLDNSSKKINLSNLYRLPIIFRNEFMTVKLNSIKKPKKLDIKREEIIKNYIKPISPNDLIQNKRLYEIQNTINKDLNKNININIIDYNQILIKKELKPVKIYNHLTESPENKKQKLKNYQKMKLQNYMKDRFYADTELKMNKKLKNIVFNHDQSLKDKIIEMNQIGDFWGGVVDYCNPYFAIKKFQYLTKRLKKNRKNYKKNIENLINKENYSSGSKKIAKSEVKTMRLFTINSYLDYKYKKKLEEKKEFLEKNNDSLQYYVF